MSLSGTEDDPEWRMAGLDWDPEAMTASRRKGGGSGAKPRASPGTAIGRTANTSCQVGEGGGGSAGRLQALRVGCVWARALEAAGKHRVA